MGEEGVSLRGHKEVSSKFRGGKICLPLIDTLRPYLVLMWPVTCFLALLGVSFALLSTGPALSYNRTKPKVSTVNTTSSIKRGVINVHIQPHSHLDA